MSVNRRGIRMTAIAALAATTFAVAMSSVAQGQTPPVAPEGVDPVLFADLMREGQGVFRTCAACHGTEGEGMPGGQEAGPRLQGNLILLSTPQLLYQIMNGGAYMPGFAANLNDRRMAAVATYVRNSWGNNYGIVTEAEVAAARPPAP